MEEFGPRLLIVNEIRQRSRVGVAGSLRRVLAVSPRQEDHIRLREILGEYQWSLHEARTCREALRLLCMDRPPVLICECHLSDGSWVDVLSQSEVLLDAPRVIVAASQPNDRLRADVIHLGGYGVLSKPLDKDEVLRVVNAAWRHWQNGQRGGSAARQIA